MIEGIQFEVTSEELIEHLATRRKYHEAKATFYKGQADALEAEGERLQIDTASNNAPRSLRDSEKSHRQKAELFVFMEKHVIPSETYRLSEGDLARIEFIDRYY